MPESIVSLTLMALASTIATCVIATIGAQRLVRVVTASMGPRPPSVIVSVHVRRSSSGVSLDQR